MPTPFEDIYIKFNVMVEDSNLLSTLTDEELDELLELFLNKSRSVYFKNCKKDLTDIDDELKQFNEDLSNEEIWILVTGMRLIWLERQIFKEEKLRDKLGTRDYSIHSPANLLSKLINLRSVVENDLRNLINSYSFNEFEGFN